MGCRALCVTLLVLLSWSYAQPPCILITPNVLRVESEETFILDGQGHGATFDADIIIQDFPRKTLNLVDVKVSLNSANGYLGVVKAKIPSKELLKDHQKNHYVYVTVKSSLCPLEKVVLLSFHSGYIFVQTDKTIYTPGSTVLYRIFTMNYKLQPISKTVVVEFLTPQGLIVKRDSVLHDTKSGIISLSYKLPELVSLGAWAISAKYEDSPAKNYTTNFEVKEYVLPSFQIDLKADQNFFYIDDAEFIVDISARFLYGKAVDGKAFALFGVKKDGIKKGIPESLRRLQITDGVGEVTLRREDLVKHFQKPEEMLEYTLYLTVTVITDSGAEMLEAELEDIFIVTSPYKIHFTKTSQYFKPGMPFDLMVFVTNPDHSPANRIQVVADPGNVIGTTQGDGTTRLTLNTGANMATLQITVNTADPRMPKDRQASATMTASPYKPLSSSGNYLHIGITASQLKPGENVPVNFNILNINQNFGNQIKHFTYMILNKGRIMTVGRQERQPGQPLVTMSLAITEEFIPSFRMVAYYTVVTPAGREIVSDSIWVDVTDSCMGTLVVSSERHNMAQAPATSMKLKLTADHKAYIGLVAVDKGVYVLNKKFKISQEKVWDSVEKTDIGCTPGGGVDGPGVFYDAGLAVQTNFRITTTQRSEPFCEEHGKRRRRSSVLLIEKKTSKASHYEGQEKKCCQDGMQENPMGHSCERRSRLIIEGQKCVDAFLDCCRYIKKKTEDEANAEQVDILDRSFKDSDYVDDADIVSRTEFPESWFWKVEHMTERPDRNGISTKILNVFLKDSITTWEVLAVSMSENKGICVAQPYDVVVMKNFFIDLRLPYSVVRNEQVEIRAILYNYGNMELTVRVQLTHNPNFCSMSTAKKNFRIEKKIKPVSSVAVPFIIVPLTQGLLDVEVKATAALTYAADGVRKQLKVVPEGMKLTQTLKSVILEPAVKGKDGVQEEKIPAIDPKLILPRTDVDTIINIQGTPISRMVSDAIDGKKLSHLIRMPGGCCEQTTNSFTPVVIATHYLDSTNQWEALGVNRRDQAIQFINAGYIRLLTFRSPDGSYSGFVNRPYSTWITAYLTKVFAMAQTLVHIESNVLCGAIKWLILQKQKPDGLFRENAPIISQALQGELDAKLTAHVLIAMLESQKTCTAHVSNLLSSIDRATTFLLDQYQALRNPYAIAISSFALAKAGKLLDPGKLMSAATDKTYWSERSSSSISLEATSYALLALLQMKQNDLTDPIARWLTEKQGVGSTQATFVMFQALAQYHKDTTHISDLDLDVSLHLAERSQPLTYRINLDNAMVTRSAETKVNKDFLVKAKGKGQGTLTVVSVFHAPVTEKDTSCNDFDLSVTLKEEAFVRRPEEAKRTVSITVCFKYLKSFDATMSIIDISMMTGFSPDINELNKLNNGVDKYIAKYEINEGATDRGTLIIYLEKISHTEEECLKIYTHQLFEVGLIQPASVAVYDYYSPESRCTRFYHVNKDSALLGKICVDAVCRCAEDNCFMQQQLEDDDITAELRLNMACKPGVDYVYKATLTEIEPNDSYVVYVMMIEQVIKEGTDEATQGKTRNFISHAKCRDSLNLQIGQDYFVWGTTSDLWNQPSGYSYLIGKDTWFEWWPNERACQDPEHQKICDDFDTVSRELELAGCQS
ncbi:complement C3-like [Discoglossus pictus]